MWGHFFPIACVPRSTDFEWIVAGPSSNLMVATDPELIRRHNDTPSSTQIRHNLVKGLSVEAQMGARAAAYIVERGLAEPLIRATKTDQDKPTKKKVAEVAERAAAASPPPKLPAPAEG